MPFIVETPPTHPGIKLYLCRKEPPSRALEMRGTKDQAVRFSSRLEAEIGVLRMSSLYGLVITQVAE